MFLLFIFGIVAAGCSQQASLNPTPQPSPVACTQEAKQCPDGSYVGRTGPNCEFAACPGSSSTTPPTPVPPASINSGIQGTITIGPTCPVERIPPDPACADKAYQATVKIETADGSKQISQFTANADGKFKVNLNPGDYLLVPQSGGAYPRAQTVAVRVLNDQYSTVIITFDSGIR